MIRFASHRLKAGFHCHALLITGREFSVLYEKIKIENRLRQSAVRISHISVIANRFATWKGKNLAGNAKYLKEEEEEDEDEDNEKSVVDPNPEWENKTREVVSMRTSSSKDDYLSDLFWNIAGNNRELFDELQYLKRAVDMMAETCGVTPQMRKSDWIELLQSPRRKRAVYLTHVARIWLKNKEKKKCKYERVDDDDLISHNISDYDDHRCYHLFHNSMFLKLRTSSMKRLLYSKVMASTLHSPEILIDCSYDQYMTSFESKHLAKQIVHSMNVNFHSKQPYHIILCNFDEDSHLAKFLTMHSALLLTHIYPITVTSKSYSDLFPKNQLVYLSPHCNNVLREIDPNKRYIIGGFVDRVKGEKISVAKAKENKIMMAKFPLDQYLHWEKGKKSLCVNHVFSIMLSMKNYRNDWQKAFEVIPRRCTTKAKFPTKNRKSSLQDCATSILELGNMNVDSLVVPDIELDEER